MRHLLDAGEHAAVGSIATSLRRHDDTSDLGALVAGVAAERRGYSRLAWSQLGSLPVALWARHAPGEFVRAGLHADPDAALDAVRALVADPSDVIDAEGWLALLGPVFGHGDAELAHALFVALDAAVGDGRDVDPDLVVNRDWLRHWVSLAPNGTTAPAPANGRVPFAIVDYGHPGRSRASANIGDHVQTVASMGHLVRHQKLSFTGPQDLVDLAHQLQGRVRDEKRAEDVAADVELLTIDRDASSYAALPPDTWTIAFGWFMHPVFEMRYDFPLHPNLRPFFVSFHCSKRELLTQEAIDYLGQYAPIGCRDWTTVDVLLSVGVPAFFSGCLTTTVSTVFPDIPERPAPGAEVAYVDVPADRVPPGAPTYLHSDDAIRFRSFTTNMYDAVDLLETYRREHPGLVTSRLHCYLPARSLGVPVDFQPRNRSDPRFAGLIDITDAEFRRIRDTISEKLQTVLTAAFSGESPDAVYALWREINAADVDAARRRHAVPARTPSARVDLATEADRIADKRPSDPDTVHVVVYAPAGRQSQSQLEVTLHSLASRATRPVSFHVVTRRPRAVGLEDLRRLAPGVDVEILDTSRLGAALRRADGGKPIPRDIDLLSLPRLLPHVERAVLLPVDALVLGDVTELADIDLEGHLLAAPTVVGRRGSSGFGLLHAAAGRLAARTAASAELRRQGHARHTFDFDAFGTDVMVLDLGRMREQEFLETYVPYVEEFSLTMREILHFEAGPGRAVLPERWHVVPTRSAETAPALLHWVDGAKPWSDDAAPAEDLWLDAATAVEERAQPTGRRCAAGLWSLARSST